MMKFANSRTSAVVAGAAVLALVGGGSAVAGNMVGSPQIIDNSVRSVDLKDGGVRYHDLAPGVRDRINRGLTSPSAALGNASVPGELAALKAQVAALTDRVEALEAEDELGMNTNWVANAGATIVDAKTVRLSNVDTDDGSSVEIVDLDLPVQATKKVEFTYELKDGAVYGGGVPRVFLQIGETYYNTFDGPGDPAADKGTDNGDGTFTKTWTIPVNGTVHNAGVVVDSGIGSVTVTDLSISGYPVPFK